MDWSNPIWRKSTMQLTKLTAITLTTMSLASGAHASEDARIKPALVQIQKLVDAAEDGPGIAIGVSDKERLLGVVVHGYADLKTKQPVTADTKFAIGSISKSFTSVVLLQMMDAKKFDPAAPISR